MGLKEQIEAWPEAIKTARVRVAEAETALAQVDLDLSMAELFSRVAADALVASSRPQTGSKTLLSKADVARREELMQQKVEAEEAAWQARDDISRARATADVQIRQEAEEAGKKLTESAIRARVQIHPDVEAAERRWREAQTHMAAMRQQVYSLNPMIEAEYAVAELTADEEPFDQEVADEAAQEAAAAHNRVRALQQQRVDLIRQLELARADVAHQRAVGKSLSMLTKIAVAQLAYRQSGG